MNTIYVTPIKKALMESIEKRFSGIIALKYGSTPTGSENFGHKVYRVAAYLDPVFHGWMSYLQLDKDDLTTLKEEIISKQ